MEKKNEKMPLDFLAGAITAAKNEVLNSVNASTVSCTRTVTVFRHDGQFLVANGNLHDKVEASFCIEFDLRYDYGNVCIKSQRIYQQDDK